MKKKGFTLVEIIISLVLIILIGTITIINLRKNEPNDDNKPQEELNTAVDVTADKFKSDDSLKQFIASETDDGTTNIISYFCFTKETLIKEGLITEENEILKNIKPNEYIKVSQDSVGTYVFDHPVTEDECSYLKSEINNDDINNTEAKIIDNLNAEENGYYLSQQITQKENVENTYEFKMDFKFNTGKLSDVSFRPDTYTVFITDGSGSMCNYSIYGYNSKERATTCLVNDTDFVKARNAAISLSQQLVSVNIPFNSYKNYVAAISFGTNIDKNVDFKETALTNDDFKFGDGSTYYYKAFDAAYNLIKNKSKDTNRFFIIFLTDGINNGGSYDTQLKKIKDFLKPTGSEVEYGKLITVGFNYNNSTLINIGSSNCNGPSTDCYYNASSSASSSSSSNIMNVFSSFLEVIEREVMCSTYKKARISINLTNNFKFSDGTQNKIIEEMLDCNEEDLTSNLQTQTLIDNALYDLTFLEPDEDTLTIGTHEFSIIENISIKFYDENNNEISEILLNEEEFPTITLNIDKIEVIN